MRCGDLVPVGSFESFVESIGRLVAADLVSWSEGRFLLTTTGRRVAPDGDGYFRDLFEEALAALNGSGLPPAPAALGLTREQFEQARAYVAEGRELRRTRRGVSGFEKWAEWGDAPPLTFADCVEFLTYSEGRDIVVRVENAAGSVRFEGTLGPPLAPSAEATGSEPVTFPVQSADADASTEHLELTPHSFATASYQSFDDIDFFTLQMRFNDGSSVTVTDANAPTI